jgi:guanylate kinase
MMGREDIMERLSAPRAGRLFVFAGPSGAGKSTVCRALLQKLADVDFSVSHTTRGPRGGEEEGRHYFFVSEEKFDLMRDAAEFAEYATVHGHRYGTSRAELETKLAKGDVLLDIDVQGAAQIRGRYPTAILIFVLPPSLQELRARLEARKQNDIPDIERRVAEAEVEIRAAADFDYFIINDRLEDAVDVATCIIKAEHQRIRGGPGEP